MLLVSAVMPTRGRCELAAMALECFLSQTYENRELVILDDPDCRSFADDPRIEGVRYHLAERRMNIPEKRNAVNALSSGELIMHFDSDDWSAPGRMAEQVARYQANGLPVIGYHSMFFFGGPDGKTAAHYHNNKTYALGTSLCYTRDYWKSHQFLETKAIASDNEFVREAARLKQLDSIPAGGLMVARAHAENSGEKKLYNYGKATFDELPEGFKATLGVTA